MLLILVFNMLEFFHLHSHTPSRPLYGLYELVVGLSASSIPLFPWACVWPISLLRSFLSRWSWEAGSSGHKPRLQGDVRTCAATSLEHAKHYNWQVLVTDHMPPQRQEHWYAHTDSACRWGETHTNNWSHIIPQNDKQAIQQNYALVQSTPVPDPPLPAEAGLLLWLWWLFPGGWPWLRWSLRLWSLWWWSLWCWSREELVNM